MAPHGFNEFATKSQKWKGKPRLAIVSVLYIHLQRLVWMYRLAWMWQSRKITTDRLAGRATAT